MKETAKQTDLSPELREIVKWSVALLGATIEKELGSVAYRRIENVRRRMASIRTVSHQKTEKELKKTFQELSRLSTQERRDFALSYTLMLELMNACENAFRTHRLRQKQVEITPGGTTSICYVLTAHPTEARSPDNIAVFHEIQKVLVEALQRGTGRFEERLKSLIEIAWQVPIVRLRKPKVQDEAEHIYSILLRDVNLSVLLDMGSTLAPISIRSWVGGDKDGHPGVDEKTLSDSLQLSRVGLHYYAKKQIHSLRSLFKLLHSKDLDARLGSVVKHLDRVEKISLKDGHRISRLHDALSLLLKTYENEFGVSKPKPLARLDRLIAVFPGLVVPLELREDSTVLMSDPTGDSLAIGRMLKRIGKLSEGGEPTWYARGMIISMAQSALHIRTCAKMIQRQVGSLKIPVVPLFEQKGALDASAEIMSELLKDKAFKKIVKTLWGGMIEVMVGYSDSAKESGVISSRLAVIDAMLALDQVCKKERVQPVFFHGSGGSVDRGGGAIQDQIAGWPKSALQIYKATIQGEMVERNFASPEILESQLLKIIQGSSYPKKENKKIQRSPALENFTNRVKDHYQKTVSSPRFLRMVEVATPYRYLSALKIGSRPTKRSGALAVSSLRAIPWVLCWTQTRVLFPTWWGVGSAWKEMSRAEKNELKNAFHHHPVFRSYLHALGFTLAKIELPIWEFYLSVSGLDPEEITYFKNEFRNELKACQRFFSDITEQKDPLWYRPWLGKSIELRASMIHPLNLLEILAQQSRDLPLLRISVTGIASGMMTTG